MQQKVLVIEDSSTSLKILRNLVEKAGLLPICAASLTEAKHVFDNSTPEEYLCALVDFHLPDAPNGEAIDYAIDSFLPTVVITGRLDNKTRETVLSKQVVDYIPKENAQVYDYLSRLMARLEKNKTVGVLVVDDSRVSRNQMTSLLRRHNFITYSAADAKEGMEMLRKFSDIRLLITDENMPNMTGVEMVAEIRRDYRKEDLGIIGISSSDSKALSARFIKSGANDFLHKPYCHEEFVCRVMQNIEHVENIEAIRRAANSDYLTGLPNRRHFFDRVDSVLRFNPQHKTLALLDLDHFKKINDSFGHDAGDKVLKVVAKLLASQFARYHVARFGGEEFCVFMPDTTLADALELLEDLRQKIENKPIKYKGETIHFTISIGLTDYFNKSIESMLNRADKNLYAAKQQGRNRVATKAQKFTQTDSPDALIADRRATSRS